MAEYGTYRIYNQLLDNPSSTVIKVSEEVQRQTEVLENNIHNEQTSKNDKVRLFIFFIFNYSAVTLGLLLFFKIYVPTTLHPLT